MSERMDRWMEEKRSEGWIAQVEEGSWKYLQVRGRSWMRMEVDEDGGG